MDLEQTKRDVHILRQLHLPVRGMIAAAADTFAKQIDPTYVAGSEGNHQLTLEVRRRLVKELDERIH